MHAMIEFYFHGYGSCGEAFQRCWPPALDGSERFFLDGPEHDTLTSQRRWFAFTALADRIATGVTKAANNVEQQVREALVARWGSSDLPVILKGHSQGAMVALELARRNILNVVEVHSYAGYLPPKMFDGVLGMERRALCLNLYSSTADRFVDPTAVAKTAALFASLTGIAVRHFRSLTLPHEFSAKWLNAVNFTLAGADP